ncbi:hypothetical protein MMC28_007592 [Mycoblastus sanguinarius]|nr:hypothetical protein [Mycoblastus sanguinarius]
MAATSSPAGATTTSLAGVTGPSVHAAAQLTVPASQTGDSPSQAAVTTNSLDNQDTDYTQSALCFSPTCPAAATTSSLDNQDTDYTQSALCFSPTCPDSSSFNVCSRGNGFLGCCSSSDSSEISPCEGTIGEDGCPGGTLEPASFDPAYYGDIQDQDCQTGSWYTCKDTDPPFLGCCTSDPCSSSGCPEGNLTAAYLSSNPESAADFLQPSCSSVGSAPSTSSPTLAPPSLVIHGSSVQYTPTPIRSSSSNGSNVPGNTSASPKEIGAIAGGAAGGVVFLAALAGLLFYHWRSKRKFRFIP